jgi:uncharacterized protein (DUF2062 family)
MAAVKPFWKKGSTISWRETFKRLGGLECSHGRTALSVGMGVALGLLPVSPFQTLIAIGLAFLLKLNRVAVVVGTLIWQPFTAPFILSAEYGLGRLVLGAPGDGAEISLWTKWVWPAALGAAVISVAGGLVSGGLTYLILERRSRQKDAPSVQEGRRE